MNHTIVRVIAVAALITSGLSRVPRKVSYQGCYIVDTLAVSRNHELQYAIGGVRPCGKIWFVQD